MHPLAIRRRQALWRPLIQASWTDLLGWFGVGEDGRRGIGRLKGGGRYGISIGLGSRGVLAMPTLDLVEKKLEALRIDVIFHV